MSMLLNDHNQKNLIRVIGFSMIPTLNSNDKLIIKKQDSYELGDILVYTYGNNILVHRLLKICGALFLCKGDNSFRLEEIRYPQILGKVIAVKRNNVIFCPARVSYKFIELSLMVNKEFVDNRYDVFLTKQSETYHEYISIRSELCKN